MERYGKLGVVITEISQMFSNMGPYTESNFNSQLVCTANTGMVYMRLVCTIVYVETLQGRCNMTSNENKLE